MRKARISQHPNLAEKKVFVAGSVVPFRQAGCCFVGPISPCFGGLHILFSVPSFAESRQGFLVWLRGESEQETTMARGTNSTFGVRKHFVFAGE